MLFEITPYLGVGPITFGLTRSEVRRRLAVPVESFVKTPTSKAPADAFDTLGIHVHYGSDERCEAVELWSTPPAFHGRRLLGQPFAELERWLRTIDPDLLSDPSGLTSMTFGFGLYAPSASHDPQTPVECVIVFRRGYYDEDTF